MKGIAPLFLEKRASLKTLLILASLLISLSVLASCAGREEEMVKEYPDYQISSTQHRLL